MDWNLLSRGRKGPSHQLSTTKTDFGLHTLVPRDSETLDCVDIVAVHGLNGHYLKTWTDGETEVNWLVDILPSLVKRMGKHARVMSFWYNSMLQFSKSTSGVLVFAHQLLDSLLAERGTEEESDRPIIFICHSLGGLVFKQAFIRAEESNKYLLLRSKISGVIFFGTPHKGSSLAPIASIMSKLLKTASLGLNTNVQLAKDLEPNSRILEHISASFRSRCTDLKLVSCYETQKMDFFNSLVVDRDSATLDLVNEHQVALDGDHRSMCRFSDVNAASFIVLKARLEELVKDARSFSRIGLDIFVASLKRSDHSTHKNRNPHPVRGTCTWILDHPSYQCWLESPNATLLWISANPGCGKSVLSSFLVDQLAEAADVEAFNICYFFFKSDSVEQADAVHAIQGLLYQLYKQQKELATDGFRLLQGANLDKLERLWTALIVSTKGPAAKMTVCILDGLDECEPKSRTVLLKCISDFFSEQQSEGIRPLWDPQERLKTGDDGVDIHSRRNSRLKIIATSRPDTRIKLALERGLGLARRGVPDQPAQARDKGDDGSSISAPIPSQEESKSKATVPAQLESVNPKCYSIIRLKGEDEADALSDDITKVVEAKINDLIDQGLPVRLLEKVRAELIVRADRTFLWVSLILKLLEEKVESGASRRELDEILRNHDIYALYGELLASRTGCPRAKKMLNIILAATRPLTVEELSIALAVPPDNDVPNGMVNFDTVDYDIVYPFEAHIKSLCGHFIRIIRDKVYLVHETAREYLLLTKSSTPRMPFSSTLEVESAVADPGRKIQATFQHIFSFEEAHTVLLNICVTYIYCLARKSVCAQVGYPSPGANALLSYAAKAWTKHYHRVRESDHQLDSSYYQNLCHPLFPGFRSWIAACWAPLLPPHPPALPEEVQHFYVSYFDINQVPSKLNVNGGDENVDDDEEGRVKKDWAKLSEGASFSWGVAYSSNPSGPRGHHFPIEADASGRVFLNLKRTRHQDVLNSN